MLDTGSRVRGVLIVFPVKFLEIQQGGAACQILYKLPASWEVGRVRSRTRARVKGIMTTLNMGDIVHCFLLINENNVKTSVGVLFEPLTVSSSPFSRKSETKGRFLLVCFAEALVTANRSRITACRIDTTDVPEIAV